MYVHVCGRGWVGVCVTVTLVGKGGGGVEDGGKCKAERKSQQRLLLSACSAKSIF